MEHPELAPEHGPTGNSTRFCPKKSVLLPTFHVGALNSPYKNTLWLIKLSIKLSECLACPVETTSNDEEGDLQGRGDFTM